MKSIYAILIAIIYCLICSCYTKQQAIDKFCNKDTASVMVTIHDTIRTETIKTDTVFNETVDSVYITKDKLEIVYIKKFGKVYIEGKCKGDTIYYEKKVLVEVPIDCPKQSWFDQMIVEAKWWLLVIIAILILVIFKRNG
ncbi:MAG: hypothetical protein RL308_2439 [Bacteroidota bacterium]|jgi:hypothetical protein